MTWSPDGSTVMSSMQGNELRGWQLESGADMTMRGYSTKVRAMDWSTKPMTLLISGAESVIAWKFSGGGPMGKPPTDIGRGIGRLVTAVAVRPRHPYVAAGFDDGQVAVCSTKEGPIIRMRPGDSDRIAALAWSADGQWLACGSESGHVSVFDLSGERSERRDRARSGCRNRLSRPNPSKVRAVIGDGAFCRASLARS